MSFIIPGNHDVNWSLIDLSSDIKIRALLKDKASVSEYLLDPKHELTREQSFLRLKYYNEFADACATLRQPSRNHLYFYTSKFNHEGLQVGIAGLNSPWRCTRKDAAPAADALTNDMDLGHLVLGELQLKAALQDLKDCDLRIALVHHPPMDSWFAEFDKQTQTNYLSEFDYILRGHEHLVSADVSSRLQPKRETTLFAAGALYQKAPWTKLFTSLVLKLDTKRQILYKWKYDDSLETWNAMVEPGARRPGMLTWIVPRLRKRFAKSSVRNLAPQVPCLRLKHFRGQEPQCNLPYVTRCGIVRSHGPGANVIRISIRLVHPNRELLVSFRLHPPQKKPWVTYAQ